MKEKENYKSRNEKLKKENDSLNSYYEYYKDLADKQNKLMRDYKSRCEKAIEYINQNKHLSMFADCRESEEDWNYDLEINPKDLLNILQGVDK